MGWELQKCREKSYISRKKAKFASWKLRKSREKQVARYYL